MADEEDGGERKEANSQWAEVMKGERGERERGESHLEGMKRGDTLNARKGTVWHRPHEKESREGMQRRRIDGGRRDEDINNLCQKKSFCIRSKRARGGRTRHKQVNVGRWSRRDFYLKPEHLC